MKINKDLNKDKILELYAAQKIKNKYGGIILAFVAFYIGIGMVVTIENTRGNSRWKFPFCIKQDDSQSLSGNNLIPFPIAPMLPGLMPGLRVNTLLIYRIGL